MVKYSVRFLRYSKGRWFPIGCTCRDSIENYCESLIRFQGEYKSHDINIFDNPCNYAFDLIQIWTIDNITCHIGSAPYKNVLHIMLAYLG